jgi:hypothetical protein
MAHEEAVEAVLRGHENRQPVAPSSRAPPLLAQARDGPREADADRAVEQADVDAELEGVGGDDAEQLARNEVALDPPPLLGGVARAVRREPRSRGAVAGTLGGYEVRMRLAKAFGKDLPAGLLEDAVAIAAAFFIVTRFS